MSVEPKNPLGMVPDPYAGDTFTFPDTLCTEQRRLWFRRANEIFAFLMMTEFAIKECRTRYEQIVSQKKLNANTPFKLESSDGKSVVTPLKTFLEKLGSNVDILCRQVFLMFYGSLETYLFELLELSFPKIGRTENILDSSLEIMMGSNWDGKFCKMRDTLGLNYKAGDIKSCFSDFEMNFEGKIFKNPLLFMDELAKIRHKIVHASSILGEGRLIYINSEVFHSYYAMCVLFTDYIDNLFVKRFEYHQVKIKPGAV